MYVGVCAWMDGMYGCMDTACMDGCMDVCMYYTDWNLLLFGKGLGWEFFQANITPDKLLRKPKINSSMYT